jgi:hypothetical protein
VRTKTPDSKNITVVVPVQFGFTETVPLKVSLAKPPPTFLASVPETFPAVSMLNLSTAAAGTGPGPVGGAGKRIVPVRVAPQLPGTVGIVAGTDGSGWNLSGSLNYMMAAGFSTPEALEAATIAPARLMGVDNRAGSISVGKTADLVLVEGDPSKRIGDLRNTRTVMMGGKLMDADALREASGFSGRPKVSTGGPGFLPDTSHRLLSRIRGKSHPPDPGLRLRP